MLFSYCLRFDDGAAPNPYWGIYTLAICKPAIRRAAKLGDWVVGVGAKHTSVGDVSGCLVYAMRVTQRMTVEQYDSYCREFLHNKIPDWGNHDFRRRVGDCIYDYKSGSDPVPRDSVHTEENVASDLSGKNVLLSSHFYCFGDNPVPLPKSLLPIVHQTQGHKSHVNESYVAEFIQWIEGMGIAPTTVAGDPQMKAKFLSMSPDDCRKTCSAYGDEDIGRDSIC